MMTALRGVDLAASTASEQGAGCGARQWHRVGAPGGAGPYVIGPARPKAATPGNRGPAVARGGSRFWVRQPAAIRRWRLPALHRLFREGRKRETGRPGRPNSKPRDDECYRKICDQGPTANRPRLQRSAPALRGASSSSIAFDADRTDGGRVPMISRSVDACLLAV
jgi:hypothetical protein